MSVAANVVYEGGIYMLRTRPALVIEHTPSATSCVVRNEDGSASSVVLGGTEVTELERIATPEGAGGRLVDPSALKQQPMDAAALVGPPLTTDFNPMASAARAVLRYALRNHATWDTSMYKLTSTDGVSDTAYTLHARVRGVHTRQNAWPVLELDTYTVLEDELGYVDVHPMRAQMAIDGTLTPVVTALDAVAVADEGAGAAPAPCPCQRVTSMAPVAALPTALTAYRRLEAATCTAGARAMLAGRYTAVHATDGSSRAVTVPAGAARVGSSTVDADGSAVTLCGTELADGEFALTLDGEPLAALLPEDDLQTHALEAAKVPSTGGRPFGGTITAGKTPELLCSTCKHAMTAVAVAAGPATEPWGGVCIDCTPDDGAPRAVVDLSHVVAALGNTVYNPCGTTRAAPVCNGCERPWDVHDASMSMRAVPLMTGEDAPQLCYSCAVTAAAQRAPVSGVLTHIDVTELETRAAATCAVRTAAARWVYAARARAAQQTADTLGDERVAWHTLNRTYAEVTRKSSVDAAWLAAARADIDARATAFETMYAPCARADQPVLTVDPVAALTVAGAHISARLLSRKRGLVARMRAHAGPATLVMPTDAAWAAAPAWVLPEYAATTGKFGERWLESMWRPDTAASSGAGVLVVSTTETVELPSAARAVQLGCPWLRNPKVGMLRVPRAHETAPEAHVVCVDKAGASDQPRTVAHVISAAGPMQVRAVAAQPAVRELWGRNAETLLKGGLLQPDSRAYLVRSTAHSRDNMLEALGASAEEPEAGTITVMPRAKGDGGVSYFTTADALTPVSAELGGAGGSPVDIHDPVRLWACAAERLMAVRSRHPDLPARVDAFVARYARGFVRHAGSDPWGDLGVMDSDAHAHFKNLLLASLRSVHADKPGAWGVYVLQSSPRAACVLRRSPTHHPDDVMYVLSHLEFDDVSGLVTYESAHAVRTLNEVTARAHAYEAAAREPKSKPAAQALAARPATAAHIHRCPLDDTLVAAWIGAASPPQEVRGVSVRALMALRASKPHGVPEAPAWGAEGRLIIGRLAFDASGTPALVTLADTMRGGRVPPALAAAALDIVPSPDFCEASMREPAQ